MHSAAVSRLSDQQGSDAYYQGFWRAFDAQPDSRRDRCDPLQLLVINPAAVIPLLGQVLNNSELPDPAGTAVPSSWLLNPDWQVQVANFPVASELLENADLVLVGVQKNAVDNRELLQQFRSLRAFGSKTLLVVEDYQAVIYANAMERYDCISGLCPELLIAPWCGETGAGIQNVASQMAAMLSRQAPHYAWQRWVFHSRYGEVSVQRWAQELGRAVAMTLRLVRSDPVATLGELHGNIPAMVARIMASKPEREWLGQLLKQTVFAQVVCSDLPEVVNGTPAGCLYGAALTEALVLCCYRAMQEPALLEQGHLAVLFRFLVQQHQAITPVEMYL